MTDKESKVPEIVATYTDGYGEVRAIHRTKMGLRVKRDRTTPIIALNRAVGQLVAERVRALRVQRGYSLEELATRIGAGSGNPKQRMWAIENPNSRTTGEPTGVRLGTVYALALALDVPISRLLPTADEVSVVVANDQSPRLVVK